MICGTSETALNDLAADNNIKNNNKNVEYDTNNDVKINEEQKPPVQSLGKQKCLFTVNPTSAESIQNSQTINLKPYFNVRAAPFTLNQQTSLLRNPTTVPLLKDLQLPSKLLTTNKPLSVDARIWRSISARPPKTATTVATTTTTTSSTTNILNTISNNHEPINRLISNAQNLSYSQCLPQLSIPSFLQVRRNNLDLESTTKLFGPIVLPNGTIQLRLREGIRVDMTLDKAIRVVNNKSGISIALANTTFSAALSHPNGKVYQYGSRVEIVAYDGMRTNHFVRYAKMWYKGISFTSENCALIYLVDSAGTRTTTESISDMSNDYTVSVYLNDSYHGGIYTEEAITVVQNSNYWYTEDGTEVYDINGFRISQTPDGLVKVTQSNNKCLIRTSPGNGSATLTTPYLHCTASLGQTSHLFVRRGERRMHFDGSSFVVRNAGHSAGFDDNNLLKVY